MAIGTRHSVRWVSVPAQTSNLLYNAPSEQILMYAKEQQRMEDDLKRRVIYGVLSMALGILATRLAVFLTNKILGKPDDSAQAIV